MDPPDPPEMLAARRYWVMQAARLAGLAIALVGGLILGGRVAAPQLLGAALFVAGAACFFGLPVLLARRWGSREP